MRDSSGQTLAVDWGHLALLALIAGVVVAYLVDARAVSLDLNNILMLQPAAVIALVLVALVVPQCFRRIERVPHESSSGSEADDKARTVETMGEREVLVRTGILAAAFAAFAASLETVGFDVACWAFMVVGLFVCGERRWWLIVLFATIFTALLVSGYRVLIPFPFPLTVM
jgi:hypothetical protein